MDKELLQVEETVAPEQIMTMYWNYYQLHADQRLRIMQYYSTAMVALSGSYASLFHIYILESHDIMLHCTIASAVLILSVICWILDIRTTHLIHTARVALRAFEKKYESCLPTEMQLFTSLKQEKSKAYFSTIFRGIYIFMLLIGILMFVLPFVL